MPLCSMYSQYPVLCYYRGIEREIEKWHYEGKGEKEFVNGKGWLVVRLIEHILINSISPL